MTIRRAFGLAAADLAGANASVRSRPLRTWATTSIVPLRPDRSSVSPSTRSNGRPPIVTAPSRLPRGRRRRSFTVVGRRSGSSTVASTLPSRASSAYETEPKLVGIRSTAIRFPARSHGRGVANASSRPRGAPSGSRVSCTSMERSVVRKAALLAPFGGRYIARWYRPPSGVTEAASPDTYVSGVIATASVP